MSNSPFKIYYVIFRKAPTKNRPGNLSLSVVTEDPNIVGERISPAAQTSAMLRTQTLIREPNHLDPLISYHWYGENLLIHVNIDPQHNNVIYVARESEYEHQHESNNEFFNVCISFDDDSLYKWLDENALFDSPSFQFYSNDIFLRMVHGPDNTYDLPGHRLSDYVGYTVYKVPFLNTSMS